MSEGGSGRELDICTISPASSVALALFLGKKAPLALFGAKMTSQAPVNNPLHPNQGRN